MITKVYNTPKFDSNYHVIELTNIQKFTFLYNNIIMLNELSMNNSFHADFKLGNVGWEDSNKMNVILIDYDIDTIQKLDNMNKTITVNNGVVTEINFASTYIPEYIKVNNNTIRSLPLEQYIKYSIGGLYEIIKKLNIKYNFSTVNIDFSDKIKVLDANDMGKSLNLLNKNFDSIPTYDEMITIFNWLYKSNLIA